MKTYQKFFSLIVVCLFFSVVASAQKIEFSTVPKNLKINEIQVLGTHNSYAKAVDPRVVDYADSIINPLMEKYMNSLPKAQLAAYQENHPNGFTMKEGRNYDHPPFADQLDAGLRGLEIDVYYDPTGGRFSDPASYRFFREKGITDLFPFSNKGLEKPGFKVLHVADLDVRSHYATFKDALTALREWSAKNPKHVPIFIMIEAKNSSTPIFPNPAEVLKFDEKAFADLDAEILDVLGRNNVITPDDIRGNYKTLREAVLAKNWTKLSDARGKFLFLLLPGTGGGDGATSPYTNKRPNLEKRVMFVKSNPEDTFGAFLL